MRFAVAVEFDAAAELGENKNSGPVAQLGARFHGMEEVVGSIPTRSTKPPNNLDGGERVPGQITATPRPCCRR
jgi:hypothetical protein